MDWYFSKNGRQLGPVEESELRAKLAAGEIAATDLVWRDGMTDWQPAGGVPELAKMARPAGGVPPAMPGPVSPYAAPAATDLAPVGYGAPIPNYLWQSIVVTIFCCWPLGIPAIVYSSKVDGLQAKGDIQGARAAAVSARNWCAASVLAWLAIAGISVIFFVLWAAPAHSHAF